MDCCWTCSGHLQENHEIELNTNLSVDTLCVLHRVSSHNLLNILKNVQHVDDFPQKKPVYHEPAMMTNMPETSNSELTDTNILINVILIVRLHTSKSNQGESRC